MSKYNLDEKNSLLSFLNHKNVAKIIKADASVDIKHFKMLEYVNASVLDKTDDTLKIGAKDTVNEVFFFTGDHVVINYTDNKEFYVMSGEITFIHSIDPIVLTIKINIIESLKNLRKNERYYVSLTSNLKVIGTNNTVFGVVKNISSSGVKINCKDNFTTDDVLDVQVILDRTNKLNFQGTIVRKSKKGDYYEYGIEIRGISELNLKCLYHYINWLSSDYR